VKIILKKKYSEHFQSYKHRNSNLTPAQQLHREHLGYCTHH